MLQAALHAPTSAMQASLYAGLRATEADCELGAAEPLVKAQQQALV